MIVLMIGGKIAPSPSLWTRRSWIHRSETRSAFRRSGVHFQASIVFNPRSTSVKKSPQRRWRRPRPCVFGGTVPVRSSEIEAESGTGQDGLAAQMIARGTTIVRDQAEIL